MQALDLLLQRRSSGRLLEPAPDELTLQNILQAGLRTPDHGALHPWRMLLIANEQREKLGEVFAQATAQDGGDKAKVAKARNMLLRAPLVIAVICAPIAEHKVPEIEQQYSAACMVHAMQMAAVAQGYGAIWRTGDMAYHPLVRTTLGVAAHEHIVGYLYIGSIDSPPPAARTLAVENYVQHLQLS